MNGFNTARYLREAIDSVRAQTYPHWEIEYYDNLSDDESWDIVASFRDPRIRMHRAPQRLTLAEGRNEAMRLSRGQWIAFLDCDDLWLPEKLERQFARVAADHLGGVGMVYARTMSFTARGDSGDAVYRYARRPLPEGNILEALLLEGNLVPIVSAMVSRAAWEAVGVMPPHLTFAEDYWLFTAIAARFRVLCVQDVLCRYRVHEAAATRRHKLASHREALEVVEHWAHRLDPESLAARRRAYHTLIGVELVRTGRHADGLREIVRRGSLAYLARGAVATLWRRTRGLHPFS